ncbi:hypothetical protein [Ornithinibacillus contaminans]|uniref:hypothetical protein n=1 Tax=Ornithinibacillus contaminans TaxID=694055 RepID=UPI001F294C7E|nr:hypothetical protein [Ornithinibacillus contaminans]
MLRKDIYSFVETEELATCSVCGNEFEETEINMTDYELDLCSTCEKDHKITSTIQRGYTMLTDKELELISHYDYQVLNNGMSGWLSNHQYKQIFDFVEILSKRNSAIDQKVIAIFKKATISGMEYLQHKDSTFIPEIKEIADESLIDIESCGKQYKEVATEFMNSYGMEDYLTKFTNNIGL